MGCGVFGIYDENGGQVYSYIYWGLKALNHRGHQSYKIVTYDVGFHQYGDLGLVPTLDQIESKLKPAILSDLLRGSVGVGNVRYNTYGKTDEESLVKDCQPLYISSNGIDLTVSYNGNIVNTSGLKRKIVSELGPLSTTTDTEIIGKKLVLEMRSNDLFSAVRECMKQIEGAYSIVGIKDGDLFAFRDSYGIRPLCYGKSEDGTIHAFASELPALRINGLEFDSSVNPGECIVVTKKGVERRQLVNGRKKAFCAFESAYFSRPDSQLPNGKSVYIIREEFGRNLAKENKDLVKRLDAVISLPETADDSAYAFHEETGIRWERAVRRHRFITDRAFIKPAGDRVRTVKRKINIVSDRLKDKIIGCVDDSIVRGDTTKNIIGEIKKVAKEVHLFVTFPKIISPCPYGIDMATFDELIGAHKSVEEIGKYINADSLHYQTLEDLVNAIGYKKSELCLGCVTRNYPTPYANKFINRMWEEPSRKFSRTGRIYE